MQCTTGHKFEIKGYRHNKICVSAQITTREIITIEEWSMSSRWFGLQKIRQYSKWTRDTTTSYTIEKEDSATIAIVQCKHCANQLEASSVLFFRSTSDIFLSVRGFPDKRVLKLHNEQSGNCTDDYE